MSEAIGSGFKLIGKRPLSVWAWGLAYLVLAGLPSMAVFGWMAPDYFSFMHQAMLNATAKPGAPPDPSLLLPMEMKIMTLQPVMFLSSLAGRAVLAAAIFRAVLEPRNTGFASLRLGSQELWLGLLHLVVGILSVIVILAVVVVGAVVGLGLGAAMKAGSVDTGWIVLVECLLGLIAAGVLIWIAVRLCLCGPMTFAEREFRLFESWRVTKGHAWSLFFMAILLAIIIAIVIGVLEVAIVSVVAATVGFRFDHDAAARFFAQPPEAWLSAIWPWALVILVVASFIIGAFSAISVAPWAVAYRGLAGGRATPPAEPAPAPAPEPEHRDEHAHAAPDSHGDPHADDHDHHGH
jgi:hypothetical protein